VRLNHAQRENNRSSFGTFSGPNLMLKLTNRRGPDGRNSRAGFGPRARLCRSFVHCLMVLTHKLTSPTPRQVNSDAALDLAIIHYNVQP